MTPKQAPKPMTTDEGPELSQEKSKVGLGEVYEKEYLHQSLGVEREDGHDGTREEARALFAKICRKLDALSNFNFAPRPSVPDAKVTPSVAAIAMEEITPIGTSREQGGRGSGTR